MRSNPLQEPGRIEDGWDVCDVNGDKIGTVAKILPDYFTMDTGFLGLGKNYRVPHSAIRETRDGKVFLSITKDRIESFNAGDDSEFHDADPWEKVSSRYHSSWQSRYGNQPGARWEEHEPGYRFGYEMHNRPEYRGKKWNEVESHFRRDWETKYHDKPWDRASQTIRAAWEDFTGADEVRGGTGMRSEHTTFTAGSSRDTDFTGSTSGKFSSGNWNDVSSKYRSRWQTRYANKPGGAWEDFEPSYRYGYEMYNRPEYRGRKWNEVEPEFRRDWETKHHDKPWDRVANSIREAWEDFTGDDDQYRGSTGRSGFREDEAIGDTRTSGEGRFGTSTGMTDEERRRRERGGF